MVASITFLPAASLRPLCAQKLPRVGQRLFTAYHITLLGFAASATNPGFTCPPSMCKVVKRTVLVAKNTNAYLAHPWETRTLRTSVLHCFLKAGLFPYTPRRPPSRDASGVKAAHFLSAEKKSWQKDSPCSGGCLHAFAVCSFLCLV